MFYSNEHDALASGVFLQLPGGRNIRVHLKHRIALADEAALHVWFGCKGHAGVKPCLKCWNVVDGSTGCREIDDTVAVYHTCTDPALFKPQTPATVRASIRRLQSAKSTMSNDDFKELERKLGWTLDRARLITDAAVSKHIQIPQAAYFDYMYIFVCRRHV